VLKTGERGKKKHKRASGGVAFSFVGVEKVSETVTAVVPPEGQFFNLRSVVVKPAVSFAY